MSLNNLPTQIQSVIQQGFLEHRFNEALTAKLGFRAIADREPFTAGVGETITKTRTGLLPAITTPMAPAANSDITSGLTPQNYNVEQYTLSVAQYGGNLQLNRVTSKVAISSLFLNNVFALGEQAWRSMDTLAQQSLFNSYMGGNTRVRQTLGAPAATVSVDDVRGFMATTNGAGQVVPVSGANPVNVMIGSDQYSLIGFAVDGVNVTTSPGGFSGTLTFASNVTVVDGTSGVPVVSSVAPYIVRPTLASSGLMASNTASISAASDVNNGRLTMQMILNAKATMSANAVPPVAETGMYHLYIDPLQATGLYQDPAFQQFFRGQIESKEYKRGVVAQMLGVHIEETNMNPVQNLAGVGTIRRGILCGQGALVESEFTPEGYSEAGEEDDKSISDVRIVDGVAMVTRPPIDAAGQVITQTWIYIGGFVTPSDTTCNPTVVPTANNAMFKRGIILESF